MPPGPPEDPPSTAVATSSSVIVKLRSSTAAASTWETNEIKERKRNKSVRWEVREWRERGLKFRFVGANTESVTVGHDW